MVKLIGLEDVLRVLTRIVATLKANVIGTKVASILVTLPIEIQGTTSSLYLWHEAMELYFRESDPKQFIEILSTVVRAGGGTTTEMCNIFPASAIWNDSDLVSQSKQELHQDMGTFPHKLLRKFDTTIDFIRAIDCLKYKESLFETTSTDSRKQEAKLPRP